MRLNLKLRSLKKWRYVCADSWNVNCRTIFTIWVLKANSIFLMSFLKMVKATQRKKLSSQTNPSDLAGRQDHQGITRSRSATKRFLVANNAWVSTVQDVSQPISEEQLSQYAVQFCKIKIEYNKYFEDAKSRWKGSDHPKPITLEQKRNFR